MRFAARRAQNAAWLHVYGDLWGRWATRHGIGIHSPELETMSDEKFWRNYARASHTAFKLAGLARVCARAKAKGRAL